MNTHIYYHCNRIKNYDCPEPYITEGELISQLVVLLPSIKLDTKFLWKEFQDEIRRLDNLQKIMNSGKAVAFEQTQHNTGSKEIKVISESEVEMITSYLLHVLKFGTPEERIKILGGIKTLFLLKERTIIVKG